MDAVSLSGKAKLDGPIGHQEESAVARVFGDQRTMRLYRKLTAGKGLAFRDDWGGIERSCASGTTLF